MNTDTLFTDFEKIVREQFEQNNANTITFDKFENVITKVLIDHITDEQRNQYERFLYWIRNEDLDNAHIVCANVELVRFGALAARPNRSKKLCPTMGPTLAKVRPPWRPDFSKFRVSMETRNWQNTIILQSF